MTDFKAFTIPRKQKYPLTSDSGNQNKQKNEANNRGNFRLSLIMSTSFAVNSTRKSYEQQSELLQSLGWPDELSRHVNNT